MLGVSLVYRDYDVHMLMVLFLMIFFIIPMLITRLATKNSCTSWVTKRLSFILGDIRSW